MIHNAATGGSVEMITDLIEKHAVNPRCKGNVSSYMFNSNFSLHSYTNTYVCKYVNV